MVPNNLKPNQSKQMNLRKKCPKDEDLFGGLLRFTVLDFFFIYEVKYSSFADILDIFDVF